MFYGLSPRGNVRCLPEVDPFSLGVNESCELDNRPRQICDTGSPCPSREGNQEALLQGSMDISPKLDKDCSSDHTSQAPGNVEVFFKAETWNDAPRRPSLPRRRVARIFCAGLEVQLDSICHSVQRTREPFHFYSF